MAVVAVKTTQITNADASPPTLNAVTLWGGRKRVQVGTYEVANGDSIGSTYRFFRVPSNARVSRILMRCDAITSAAMDVGLYQTAANGGAVVDADAYASAASIATAITTLPVDLAYEARDIANVTKRVFEDAGLSTDSQREYDIVATLTAAATAGGTLTMTLEYVID